MIENLMLEACVRLGAAASKTFMNDYLIKQSRLKLIYKNNIYGYIEILCNQRADSLAIVTDLESFLKEL